MPYVTESWLCFLVFVLTLNGGFGAEISLWNIEFNSSDYAVFRKTLYANTTIYMRFHGDCKSNQAFNISWYLLSSSCYNDIFNTADNTADIVSGNPGMLRKNFSGFRSQGFVYFPNCSSVSQPRVYYEKFQPPQFVSSSQGGQAGNKNRTDIFMGKPDSGAVAKSWSDSPYLFVVDFSSQSANNQSFKVTVNVEMIGPRQYSSPADWPLMMFFMGMCIIYVFFGALWLLWCVCYWRDLLRIQFWIGAVIILGMLEKAVFYNEYQSIRYHGVYVQGAVIFAELLSALKRSLARVLIVIVSLGYGIVKPRLGTTVHRLVAVGLLYLIFSSVEGVLRVTDRFNGTVALIANLSLSLIDSCVMWWIFISLSQTIRFLKLRRNVVKLSLYQHFTNTLIFSVVASIVFIIWSVKVFRLVKCQTGWKDLWLDDAFWRLLFSTILLVIMVLLRPSMNSQRFSHSPLIDEDDEEDDAKEPMLNEAFDGMKMRGTKGDTNASQKLLGKESSQDDDMKWVEENIPTTVIDVALPVMLDEEEEILNTKMERSKME
ncbi:transmembrane protein 87A [Chanos chanos]|uniref:Transmembrane protein 87A n=1 Tax=Chanos chanos TaxID=29144 RepID=A0A6J2W9G7_CHACN|nr:transmembrane protein 87A [Chanos chanos]